MMPQTMHKTTEKAMLEAFRSLETQVADLESACYALDALSTFEFDASFDEREQPYPFKMTSHQHAGITYMIGHVRRLCVDLDRDYRAALRGESHDPEA